MKVENKDVGARQMMKVYQQRNIMIMITGDLIISYSFSLLFRKCMFYDSTTLSIFVRRYFMDEM